MPLITIQNLDTHYVLLNDPEDTSVNLTVGPLATESLSVSDAALIRLRPALANLRGRTLTDGTPSVLVDVDTEDTASGFTVARWAGNHVGYGVIATDPTTAPTTSILRIDHSAGEAYVDGVFYEVAAAADTVGDAQVEKDGLTAFAGALANSTDTYGHWLLIENSSSLELLLVLGDAADTGAAVVLTRDELAEAVGAYRAGGAADPHHSFTHIATVLYAVDGGGTLVDTTSVIREMPDDY